MVKLNDNLTQQIGERIGWDRGKVNQYLTINYKIDTDILELSKQYQNGRVSNNDTNVSFDFTEGWFRNSNIYELSSKRQIQLIKYLFMVTD